MTKKNKKDTKDYYTQTGLKALGFTPKMIEALLPEPLLRPNPMYRSAAPMKLWLVEDVNKVIDSEEFIMMREASASRRKSAAKAIKTKRDKLHKEVEEKIKSIEVEKIKMKDLKERALRHKQRWYNYVAEMRGTWSDSVHDADKDTVKRWMVNYVRHNLTRYDSDLYDMSNRVGCREEYKNYKFAVLDKIAETYPRLKKACEAQKEYTERMKEMREWMGEKDNSVKIIQI